MRSLHGFTEQRVGRYRLEEQIAEGKSGTVYVAYDTKQGHPVTLRLLHGSFTPESDVVNDFRWSVHAAAEITHQAVARVRRVGVSGDNRLYLISDYISDHSLQEELAAFSPTLAETAVRAVQLVRHLAEALVAAHRAGIVHKQLSPDNILLQPDGTPVLLGLDTPATYQLEMAEADASDAFQVYLSPEQRQGKALDGRSNVYSLGVILYQLLAGEPPRPDSPALEQIRPGLSPETYRIVRTSLQAKSWGRFQSMGDMLAALEEALSREQSHSQETMLLGDRRQQIEAAALDDWTEPQARGQPLLTAVQRVPIHWWLLAVAAFLLLLWGVVALLLAPRMGAISAADSVPGTNNGAEENEGAGLPPPATQQLTPDAVTPADPAATTLAATPTLAAINEPTAVATPTPPLANSGDVVAPRINTPPVIDGDLSEWAGVPGVDLPWQVYSATDWDGSVDLQVDWRLSWDETNLYAGVTVTDGQHVQEETARLAYLGDSLEMQIDTELDADYGPGLSPDDFQILLSPGNFNSIPPSAFRFRGRDDGGIGDAPGANITVAARPTADGYTLEAAIPWRDLGVNPQVGLIMGLALNANDNDTPGSSTQEVMLSHVPGRTLTDPTTWGRLILR